MKDHIVVSIRITIALLVITCGVYPVLVWGIGQIAFHHEANGSLITSSGRVIGSELIAQSFSRDRYFHSRPSTVDYDGMNSGGSNLGPTAKKLVDSISTRLKDIPARPAPADAVTASASGLDPHVSPANALLQASRVARARGIDESRLRALIDAHTERRFLGVFGEPRVNVLLLNLALDRGVS
ncbi:MAG TPA: K(+)-transporting ATPase subunit C [Thermoanaerobaculia bacterium]